MISQNLLPLFYTNNYSYFSQQESSETISILISSHAIQYVFPTHIGKSVNDLTVLPVPQHPTFSIFESLHTAMQLVTFGLPCQNSRQPNEYVVSVCGSFRISIMKYAFVAF